MADPQLAGLNWHVTQCLRGTGRRVYHDERDFVFYVQRYLPPGQGFTGQVRSRTWDTEGEALAEAERLNSGGEDGPTRLTYL